MTSSRRIFIAGGTGYLGRHLIPVLLKRGHEVIAVIRKGSEAKLTAGCAAVFGDVLNGDSYRERVSPDSTFVQLVGVPHPAPSKAKQFVEIDRRSAMEAVRVARDARVGHFVYVSVAHPAPVMKVYTAVRAECEEVIRESGLDAAILRPWYVLGPGHNWPRALVPFYRLAERLPSMAEGARRLGLVSIDQMTKALLFAIENPSKGVTVLDVPRIRAAGTDGV